MGAQRVGDIDALNVVRVTLERMAEGGIHDQLGGGFCRYSVDAEWSIPHFEKMLYDNGPLLGLYADAARVTGDSRLADVARGIAGWMMREMRAPDGAFWSSLDADSEGEEGRFYVWSRDEVRAVLGADDYAVAAPYFGLDGPPNFEGHAWHLRIAVPLADVAARLGLPLPDAIARLERAKAALFAVRAKRVRPGLDDKILTSWNALAIAGLARAARALDEPAFADLAAAAADALRATAWRDGRLLAARKDARTHFNAYLDDHAFLLAALVELMQTRFRRADFEWARELCRAPSRPVRGPRERRLLLHEPRPRSAVPSHEARPRQRDAVGQRRCCLRVDRASGTSLPSRATSRPASARCARSARCSRNHRAALRPSLAALDDALSPPSSVFLAGDAPTCLEWQRALERTLRPGVRVFDLAGRDVPARMAKGAPPVSGRRGLGLPGHAVPSAGRLARRDRGAALRVDMPLDARRQGTPMAPPPPFGYHAYLFHALFPEIR